MNRVLALAVVLAACTGADDPCGPADNVYACVPVRVTSKAIARIDQLELDVLYSNGTFSTAWNMPQAADLPVTSGIGFTSGAPASIQVVIAGHLGDLIVGTGYGSAAVGTNETLAIAIEPVADPCVPGGAYCGGDKVAGDPSTLYRCGAQGMAYARGACAFGCKVAVGHDDACYGGGQRCVAGTTYCGGDKIDGDPSVLYTCQADGTGTVAKTCANGCAVIAGRADVCR